MVDLYLAHNAPLELFRGVTRSVRIRLFEKATGGDTVAGQPTAALSKGPAEDWSDYPIVVAGLAPAVPVFDDDGVLQTAQLRCEWFTTNPAEITLTIEADAIEDALALRTDIKKGLVYTIVGRRDTAAVVEDEVVLVHGPVYVTGTAVVSGMAPLE